ncbi:MULTISPECIES: hypothetical protein [unclassified Streptomyces]|uniref:hypothetical protein n=1 Tax=unclassified Streptomyces TaxID=2593676 RepID=UPI0029A20EC5|nr:MULTISPECIES: hypothetical protein [unclassified Streptomyces]MDX3766081.1 hypothetical protein [Streptomyces sp. AK08-01B]MDX3815746.1 hypothetical protein [Streptomyces sp. AK08-01A]
MGRKPFQFEGDYAAVLQEEYQRRARDSRFDYRHRVEFAAMGWANVLGHAEFPSGELNKILVTENGEVPSNGAVNNHVRRAKGWDLVEAESNRRCLVLPVHRFQKGIGDQTCDEHGIRPAKRFRP